MLFLRVLSWCRHVRHVGCWFLSRGLIDGACKVLFLVLSVLCLLIVRV